MSEFPFAEPAVAADNYDGYDDAEASSKRALLIGGLAAALVVGAGGFFLLSGGGEEEVFTPVKRAPRPAAAAPVAPAAKIPAVFAAPVGRDPFRALYTVPAAGSGPAANPAPAPVTPVTSTPIVIVQPAQPAQPTQPTGSTGGGTTTPSSPAPAPQQQSQSTIRITGYDPPSRIGTFLLDGKTTVQGKVDDVLAKKVLIIAIRPDREQGTFFATLKVGDGAQFDVHYGQTVVIP